MKSQMGMRGVARQVYASGPAVALQPEQMILLLQAVGANQGQPEQMAWLKSEYPAVYKLAAEIPEDLMLRGLNDPSALKEVATAIQGQINHRLEQMRWDDLGLSPLYESAARQLFPKPNWNFIQDLPVAKGEKAPRFVMEEDAYRPLIPGQTRVDQKLFDWDMSNDLEDHLKALGVEDPDVREIEFGSFLNRVRTDFLHIRPENAALLVDAHALGKRGERLGDGAKDWHFARRIGGKNVATLPVDLALGMRGVSYGLPDKKPETIRLRCATRVAQRMTGNPDASIKKIDGQEHVVVPGEDGKVIVKDPINVTLRKVEGQETVVMDSADARLLLAPVAVGDPASRLSMRRQEFDAGHEGYRGENGVFLVQAAKLAYQEPATVKAFGAAWGLSKITPISHAESDAQAFVAYDAERNTVVVSFRGTESKADIRVDADISMEKSELFPDGKVPSGFLKQFKGLLPEIMAAVDDIRGEAFNAGKPDPSIMGAGHSLGGALAAMFMDWCLTNDKPITQVYTCGQPGFADKGLAAALTKKLAASDCQYYRYVNNNDIVARMPPTCTHVGEEVYINHQGRVEPPGFTQNWSRTKDRLVGMIDNWSLSSGIDAVDSISDHYVDFYLAYARKNRAIDFIAGALGGVVGGVIGAAVEVGRGVLGGAAVVVGGAADIVAAGAARVVPKKDE